MKLILTFILTSSLFVLASSAHASPLSFSVSPAIIEITADSPNDIKKPIQIINEAEETQSFDIKLIPFVPKKAPLNIGEVEFLNIELPIKNFVTIEDESSLTPINELMLRPREQRNLLLHLSIPIDQEQEDSYFSVVFLSKKQSALEEGTNAGTRAYSNIRGGVGVNILLSIGKKEKTDLQVVEFRTAKFIQNGPLAINVKFKNDSKHFIKAGGKIMVTNMFGQKIAILGVPFLNILARSSRSYPPIVFPETFLLGPYTAQLQFNDSPIVLAKTTFYAFPIKQVLLIGLIVIILLVVKKRIEKRFSR